MNQETIFTDGDSYFESLLVDIDKANRTIDLETYIFEKNSLGIQVSEHLIAVARRGVKVRLLVDSAGTPNWGGGFVKKLEKAGIETRVFHPFPWRLWQWGRSVIKAPFILKILYLFLKINSRNHRKVCVIDNRIAYIGSMNITKCHLTKAQGGDAWRDTAIRLQDTDLTPLTTAFNAAWNHLPIQERIRATFKHVTTNPIIRLNYTRHRRRILYKNLLKRISRCKNRIWITNAYFVPDNFLLKKLKEKARNDIDVRILLSQKSDVAIMPWAWTVFYEQLLKAGVRIFEYIPSILHAKTLILDDWVLLGSSNLNHRSLLHDLEVDINVRSEKSKKIIMQQFLDDLNNAKEIVFTKWEKRVLYQRILGRLVLYMKYWI